MAKSTLDMTSVASATALAAAFGVSTQTVTRWKKRGLPIRPDGSFNLSEFLEWRLGEDRIAQAKKRKTTTGDEWDERGKRALAMKRERELEILEAEWIHTTHVERMFVDRARLTIDGFEALKARLRAIANEAVRDVLEEVTDEVRQAWSNGNVSDLLREWSRTKRGGGSLKKGRGRPRKD